MDTRLDSFKIASKKAREFIGDEIVDAVTKSNNDNIEKKEPVEEIIIQLEKRWNIKQIEKITTKVETIKHLSY